MSQLLTTFENPYQKKISKQTFLFFFLLSKDLRISNVQFDMRIHV